MHNENTTTRFWKRVNKDGPVPSHMPHLGKCWPWAGAPRERHGTLTVDGATRKAHRVAWEIAHGPIPAGMYVCHRCDNPPCVKAEADEMGPAHLFLGTQKDNMRDCADKGRLATGDRNGSRTHPETLARGMRHGAYTRPECVLRGASNGSAKLSAQDVECIRKCYATGLFTQTELGAAFFVSGENVGRIVRMERWKS